MLLFWKEMEETQISKPPEATRHPNLEKKNIGPSIPQGTDYGRPERK